jgi:hypothetical protein
MDTAPANTVTGTTAHVVTLLMQDSFRVDQSARAPLENRRCTGLRQAWFRKHEVGAQGRQYVNCALLYRIISKENY